MRGFSGQLENFLQKWYPEIVVTIQTAHRSSDTQVVPHIDRKLLDSVEYAVKAG